MISKNSELYYSDEMSEQVALDLSKMNGVAANALQHAHKFVSSLTDKVLEWELSGVQNIMSSVWIDPQSENIVWELTGASPWSQEKIEAFKKGVSEKVPQEDDGSLDLLASLIESYPDATVEILAKVLKEQKVERSV